MLMEIIKERTVLEKDGIKVKDIGVQLLNKSTREIVFFEFDRGPVIIIPRTKDGRFIIIKQNRLGIEGKNIEFPSGGIEKGESPVQAAERELLEETGAIGTLTSVGWFNAFTEFTNLKVHVFLATDLDVDFSRQNLEPSESFTPEFITENDLLRNIASNDFSDAYLLSPLMKYYAYIKNNHADLSNSLKKDLNL